MNECPHCGHAAANDGDLLKEPALPVEGGDSETSAKDEILSELIELMQGQVASKLPKKEDDEDDEFQMGMPSTPITGTN